MKASLLVTTHTTPRRPRSVVDTVPVHRIQIGISLACFLFWCAACLLVMWASPTHAQEAKPQDLQAQVASLLQARAPLVSDEVVLPGSPRAPAAKPRVEVVLGQLDPRLKLAPCDKVLTYMPEGVRLWGKSRVGMRCEQGAVRWNVSWPVTVKVWAPAVVAVVPLKPGSIISVADLRLAEVDLAEAHSPAVLRVEDVIGRSVMRQIEPGQSLRQDDVRMRRWFAAGEPVQVLVKGPGFQASADGMAISHGDEGQCAKVRVEGGRVLCGFPVGDRRVEVSL
ncbi:MAG: flagella basal body P-ring formation protein FlgA [Pseudomonadota bacterium]|jgi:flagella basal body P-ring formation protein FlgA